MKEEPDRAEPAETPTLTHTSITPKKPNEGEEFNRNGQNAGKRAGKLNIFITRGVRFRDDTESDFL